VRGQGTTFFARALAGVGFVNQRLDLTAFGGQRGEGSDTAFAAAFGGGLDLHLSERVSFRAIQADYLLTRFGDSKFQVNGLTLSGPDTQHNLRFSTGFVFRNRD
jgi:opacity protein-like surface antigen